MTIVEYPGPAPGRTWTKEWEQAAIGRLAAQVGGQVPEHHVPWQEPVPGKGATSYYDYFTAVAGLDQFIFQSCARGVGLVEDPEFQILLTRQIGDDGSHAQRYRQVIAGQTGHDPITLVQRHAEHEWDFVGDITGDGLVGFLAFEISYELYTAPEFLITARTGQIADPDLLASGASRFGPDEFAHRQGIANWLRTYLASLDPGAEAELVAELRHADDVLWARRTSDIKRRWDLGQDATAADYELIWAIRTRWRQVVHEFLFAPA